MESPARFLHFLCDPIGKLTQDEASTPTQRPLPPQTGATGATGAGPLVCASFFHGIARPPRLRFRKKRGPDRGRNRGQGSL